MRNCRNGGVSSVEVLKGANSVLYGADALAGVVNVTTQRGTSSIPELKISSDGGNFGTHYRIGVTFRRISPVRLFLDCFRDSIHREVIQMISFITPHTRVISVGRPTPRPASASPIGETGPASALPMDCCFMGSRTIRRRENQNTYLAGTVQNQTTSRWHNLFRFAYGQFNSTYVNPSPTGAARSLRIR